MYTARLPVVLLCFCAVANAQFGFFDRMFHHEQEERPSAASQWQAHLDAVSCNQYLCPTTLNCVKSPSDCPCPYVEDIKCIIPDKDSRDGSTVVCARGQEGCDQIKRLSKKL
ncbi:hypothetical protein CYLTODRAFT_416832 [Cylindrobasidium torrendii FP15055 ss-10]|uniref:Long chronological lifespan protein 2 n=1 Tax=Cylindrobasidium torrendii FP15055 ss-10 TaxID=1314674 RepID=A0A0D7BTT5_9AGAR|nr:hypothetical protein CYLTODRAFT_416832 [Cylindrobasidium torrendii FP15055 ss-10]